MADYRSKHRTRAHNLVMAHSRGGSAVGLTLDKILTHYNQDDMTEGHALWCETTWTEPLNQDSHRLEVGGAPSYNAYRKGVQYRMVYTWVMKLSWIVWILWASFGLINALRVAKMGSGFKELLTTLQPVFRCVWFDEHVKLSTPPIIVFLERSSWPKEEP